MRGTQITLKVESVATIVGVNQLLMFRMSVAHYSHCVNVNHFGVGVGGNSKQTDTGSHIHLENFWRA